MSTVNRLVALALCGSLFATPTLGGQAPEPEDTARALVAALGKDDFAAVVKLFDATMQKALPADKLAATWKTVRDQFGALQKTTALRREKVDKYEVVVATCQFEKATLDIRIAFNADKQVGGLFIVPSKPPEYQPPAYVKKSAFEEMDVQVGAGEWVLSGTLSRPVGDGPFPVVVLVHGSGPHDRDETIGPNRPFRDLAWGLASRGVAVLRYEKRTKEHGSRMAQLKGLTVKEEVVDDALAAVRLLKTTPKIDARRIFVLGHSLGGTLAPRLAEADPAIAGLVLLAGASRPLEDLIVEQTSYLLSLDGPLSEESKRRLETIKAQVARVKDPKLTPDTPAEQLPLGVPAAYWLALRNYRPAEVAGRLKQPLLILQGERDYQVTMADFEGWKQVLAKQNKVAFRSYPRLNHLFIEGTGKSKPGEYLVLGHVAEQVVADVADWVKK